MYQLPFDQLLGYRDVLIEVPSWWFQAALAWLGVIGLLLWLFGRRLLQPGLALVGLGAGAVTTLMAANAFGLDNVTYWVLGGALAGALVLGLLLWRLVLALLVTLAVMAAAPWGVVAFNGWPVPPVGEPIMEAASEVRQVITGSGANSGSGEATGEAPAAPQASGGSSASDDTGSSEEAGGSGEGDSPEQMASTLDESFRKAGASIVESGDGWWSEELSTSQRRSLLGACIGGGVLALLLSLALPSVMASLVTALVGAVLVYSVLVAMLPQGLAGMISPGQPRQIIIGLLAATLLGVMLQTLFLRQKAEA